MSINLLPPVVITLPGAKQHQHSAEGFHCRDILRTRPLIGKIDWFSGKACGFCKDPSVQLTLYVCSRGGCQGVDGIKELSVKGMASVSLRAYTGASSTSFLSFCFYFHKSAHCTHKQTIGLISYVNHIFLLCRIYITFQ